MKIDLTVSTEEFCRRTEALPYPKFIKFDYDLDNPPDKVKEIISYLILSDDLRPAYNGEFIVSDEIYQYLKNELDEYLIFVWADAGR